VYGTARKAQPQQQQQQQQQSHYKKKEVTRLGGKKGSPAMAVSSSKVKRASSSDGDEGAVATKEEEKEKKEEKEKEKDKGIVLKLHSEGILSARATWQSHLKHLDRALVVRSAMALGLLLLRLREYLIVPHPQLQLHQCPTCGPLTIL